MEVVSPITSDRLDTLSQMLNASPSFTGHVLPKLRAVSDRQTAATLDDAAGFPNAAKS